VDVLKAGVSRRRIAQDEVAAEWIRSRPRSTRARRELEDAAVRVEEQPDAALAGIFRAHADDAREYSLVR
jgi:hypothetical protein